MDNNLIRQLVQRAGGDALSQRGHGLRLRTAVERTRDQTREFAHVLGAEAQAHDLRRADAQAVDVARHGLDRQADAAGEQTGSFELLRCGLATTPARGRERKLVRARAGAFAREKVRGRSSGAAQALH